MSERPWSEWLDELERRAEARLAVRPPTPTPGCSPQVARLLHELEVQRAELEVQNEELRETQLQLQAARDRYFSLYDLAPVGYLTLDAQGAVREANLQACRLLGLERGRVVGQRLHVHVEPASHAELGIHLGQVFGVAGRQECALVLKHQGRHVRLQSESRAPQPGQEELCRSVLVDVSALVEAEGDARATNERLRAVLDTALDGIVSLDEAGRVDAWNRAAEHMFGYPPDQVLGRELARLLAPGDGQSLRHDLKRGEARRLASGRQVVGLRADGSRFLCELRLAPRPGRTGVRGFTAVLRDLSERERLEAQLRQSQKLEPIGRLASELAHEYGNLLMGIRGFTSMALDALQDSPARVYVEEVRAAAGRGSALAAQLLAFTRREQISREALPLDESVVEICRLVRALLRAEVVLELDLRAPGACVLAGPGDLEQVLLNLAVNASDAMPAGGRLVISTRLVAGEALIEVADEGIGMDEATRGRLFEPFFTTKPHGTGLGLAAIQRVVDQLQGSISVQSAPGQGTTFRLALPVCEPATDEAAAATSSGELPAYPRPPRVLVVEDERLVLVTVEHYLRRAGCEPLLAQRPETALELAGQASPGSIDVLLTDVSLPGMGGRELAAALRDTHPGLQVLYMSAFARDQLLEEGRIDPHAPTLEKPFDEEQLRRSLARLRLAGGGDRAEP